MVLRGQRRNRANYGLLRAASALILAALAVAILPGLASASFPGANGKIVFTGGAPGRSSEIFIANADGTGVTDLTDHPAQDLQPAWSPDGRQIAFASDRVG